MQLTKEFFRAVLVTLVAMALVTACGGNGHDTVAVSSETAKPLLTCDETMKTAFKPDALSAGANATVLLVKAFKQGEPILLSGTSVPTTPIAASDMCLVKLMVGPANPGPLDAPSTTPGIGIEVWLPNASKWNNRFHALGNSGFAGGPHATLTAFAGASTIPPWTVAGVEGAVAATTDTGHRNPNGAFLMNADGTVNTLGWQQFSATALHEMSVKTKALAVGYYGKAPKYSYFHGSSTGGRQALKLAQTYPDDFDGIISNRPAINWSRFTAAELYPQIVMQRELGGKLLTSAQLSLVSMAAIKSCDVVGGQHLGYILEPSKCTYDPTTDAQVLCAADGGANATPDCLSPTMASVVNKIWYGQTTDGSVPSPLMDNGYALNPAGVQKWWGLPRGADLTGLAGAAPFSVASDMVALSLQDPTLATPAFLNATGNGQDRWKNLSYENLSNAANRGVALQGIFANIDTDNPDLSKFRDRGGKMIGHYGLSDNLIPHQGFINYYNRVLSQLGGLTAVQGFYRMYMNPGQGHVTANGTANPNANPPSPTEDQMYAALTAWVETGVAPGRIDVSTVATSTFPVVKSRPMCVYPLKPEFVSGDVNLAASWICS
jgi:feruloyl esterase